MRAPNRDIRHKYRHSTSTTTTTIFGLLFLLTCIWYDMTSKADLRACQHHAQYVVTATHMRLHDYILIRTIRQKAVEEPHVSNVKVTPRPCSMIRWLIWFERRASKPDTLCTMISGREIPSVKKEWIITSTSGLTKRVITCTFISLSHQIRRFSPKYPFAVFIMQCNPSVWIWCHLCQSYPDTLIWGQRLCLVRWMWPPIAFKQLRNPIVGVVPIVTALAPLIRSTLNHFRSRGFHCNKTGKQYCNSLLTALSKLTTSVILLVHLPCTQLSLCLSIIVGIQHKRVLARIQVSQTSLMSVRMTNGFCPSIGVVIMPMMKKIVATILQLLYKLGDRITKLK